MLLRSEGVRAGTARGARVAEQRKFAILVMELKGFAALATELARRIDYLGITPERIRQAGRKFIKDKISSTERAIKLRPIERKDIGGDTWYFTFNDCQEAVRFGAELLIQIYRLATTQGLYYLKPSLALNIGVPRVSGERFLDDASIAAYRLADSGEPFLFQVLPGAELSTSRALSRLKWKSRWVEPSLGRYASIDWRATSKGQSGLQDSGDLVQLTTLLMDNDVVFFRSTEQVLDEMVAQQ